MRKRTLSYLLDNVYWYLLYFLPVVLFAIYLINGSNATSTLTFTEFLSNNSFSLIADNIVSSTLSSIFGVGGVLPLFETDLIFTLLGWFVSVFLCHLLVDFVLFIPRLSHKWLKKLTQGDD